jgi:hypothetical protein
MDRKHLTEAMNSELTARVGAAVVSSAPAGWARITLTVRATVVAYEFASELKLANGKNGSLELPEEVKAGFRELRTELYQPGRGTWFSARLTVEAGGRPEFSFNFDEDPNWWPALHPTAFSRDLAAFPREDEHVPPWLRELLDSGDRLEHEREARG